MAKSGRILESTAGTANVPIEMDAKFAESRVALRSDQDRQISGQGMAFLRVETFRVVQSGFLHILLTLYQDFWHRHAGLAGFPDDLRDLFRNLDIPIVLLDEHGRIPRFTLAARRIFNLGPAHACRPLCNVSSMLEPSDWIELVLSVQELVEKEVFDTGGHWHWLSARRTRPVMESLPC